ncbi:MAG: MoaD/ThiS family protein [Sphingorhabdus sp.]
MQLVYFARVREAIGFDGEERIFPADVMTVVDCLDWLASQGTNYAAAFATRDKLRFALDQQMVGKDAAIAGAGELAIFPPVTGG